MATRDSLENYALFYEKIDAKSAADNSAQHMQDKNSYDKNPCLKKEDLSKLSEDLRSPMRQSPQTDPMR